MKLYNPFKPHIIEFQPLWFAVRKWSVKHLGWAYKDSDGNFYVSNYSSLRTLDEAKERLAFRKKPKFKPKVIY